MDNIQKQRGVPFSTSRAQERVNKHRTHKARRQEGRRFIRREVLELCETSREFAEATTYDYAP